MNTSCVTRLTTSGLSNHFFSKALDTQHQSIIRKNAEQHRRCVIFRVWIFRRRNFHGYSETASQNAGRRNAAAERSDGCQTGRQLHGDGGVRRYTVHHQPQPRQPDRHHERQSPKAEAAAPRHLRRICYGVGVAAVQYQGKSGRRSRLTVPMHDSEQEHSGTALPTASTAASTALRSLTVPPRIVPVSTKFCGIR